MSLPEPAEPGPQQRSARGRELQREFSASSQTKLISGGVGLAFVAAGATGLLSLVFPPASYGSRTSAAVVASFGLLFGIGLLLGRARGRPWGASSLVLAIATATVSAGVYAGGAPESGAVFFYLWVIPYAFALLSPRRAVAQAGWMAACYALVLAIQSQQHPGFGAPGELAGMWFLAVVTVLAVGMLVRVLSRSLRDSDRRFHRAFQDSRIGAAFVTTDGLWLEVNDAFCRVLGRSREELVGESLLAITAPEDRDSTEEAVVLAGRGAYEFEKRYVRPDGSLVSVAVAAMLVTPEAGPPYLFAQYRDVTEHNRDRETLAFRAVHDPLTGLFNRTLLLDRLEEALERGKPLGLVLLDLDGFKIVNDSLGHQAGDEVLIAVARRLSETLPARDTIARFGGDEFVVLREGLESQLDALDCASRVVAALNLPVELGDGEQPLNVSLSVGVATSQGRPDTASTLLGDADAAMYRAKTKGRGRVELFDHTMREEATARLQLESELQLALQEQEFVLDYQPIVATRTLRPVAFEALLRWNHPRRGRLLPGAFIPLAEETGVIVELGAWVIANACTQLARWQRSDPGQEPIAVSVNVSASQLAVPGFAAQVSAALREAQLAPASLWLEITESAIVSEAAPAAALAALSALGVRILLDDFGTGYSSLAYLTRFPIDTLKIDQAFVASLEEGPHGTTIAKAIVAIGHELELDVIAEGVEDEAQLSRLRALECGHVQGFLISRPLRAAAVPAYLRATLRREVLAPSA